MEASLTCAVCLSLFEEPVTLPLCSHNFCKGCVRDYLASGEPGPPRAARFSCPLCRKLCSLPRGGCSALPVNTTLAEVVKLYRAGGGKGGPGPGEAGAVLSPLPAYGAACEKHPARLMQLYCRMCRRAGCGQCVSEEHQGVFHAVNLLETVYQEEKLTFFSSLKKLRTINENLEKELLNHPKDTEILNKEAETVTLAFEEIFKTLERRKKELLEDIERQKSKKEKEYQIWKKMKETHKKTIESFLKDYEKLVDECDPEHFLEVACGLNKRVKTQLDLMHIASSYEKAPKSIQKQMDIKSVVNEILALQLTSTDSCIVKELSSGENESLIGNTVHKSCAKQWNVQKKIHKTFYPLVGHEETLTDDGNIYTRLMSISAFQDMSHEEIRYNYYMAHRKSDQLKTQISPANTKPAFVIDDSLKGVFSAVPLLFSSPKVKDAQRIKTQKLQKGSFSNTSFNNSSSYRLSFPAVHSELNSDLELFNGRICPEVSKVTSPSENSSGLLLKNEEKMAQTSLAPISVKTLASANTSPGLLESAMKQVTVSNSTLLDTPAEGLCAPHFIPMSGMDSALPNLNKSAAMFSFNNLVFPNFFMGRCDNQDKMDNQNGNYAALNSLTDANISAVSVSPELGPAESGKPVFEFAFSKSERDCFTVSKFSNSLKISPSSSQPEKPAEQSSVLQTGNETVSVSKDIECNDLKSTVVPRQQRASASDSTAGMTSKTSNGDVGKKDVSKTQPLSCNNLFFSSNNCIPECKSLPVTSMLLFSNNEREKMKMESLDKAHPIVEKYTPPLCTGAKSIDKAHPVAEKSIPPMCVEAMPEFTNPQYTNSFFSLDTSVKTEMEDALVQQNSLFDPAVLNSLFPKVLPSKGSNIFSIDPSVASTKSHTDVKVEDQANVGVTYQFQQDLGEISRKQNELETLQLQDAACVVPVTCETFSESSSQAVGKEGEILSNSDSDIEELSQASMSSDCSSASEYFSVSEDKNVS